MIWSFTRNGGLLRKRGIYLGSAVFNLGYLTAKPIPGRLHVLVAAPDECITTIGPLANQIDPIDQLGS